MADERTIERWFERGLDVIIDLSRQVARTAWALECQVLKPGTFAEGACSTCRTQLVPRNAELCPACHAPQKEKTNAGHREPTE